MEAAAPSAWVCTACGSPVLGDESVWTVTVRHEMVTPLPGLRPPAPRKAIAFCERCGPLRDFERLTVPPKAGGEAA